VDYRPKSKAEIAKNMGAIRSRDNKTELALRKALHARGLRYRLHPPDIEGRPDIVFVTARVVIFVDGDFWHARLLKESGVGSFPSLIRTPKKDYWLSKFTRRIERDDKVSTLLREDGWHVLRFWESDIRRDLEGYADTIYDVVKRRKTQPDLKTRAKSPSRKANR
jgi:DNA mismatch endonuclease (patch repair protein)